MVAVLLWRSIPAAVEIAAWKKSKTLLLSMTLPELWFGLAEPSDMIPLVGKLAPAGPMLLLEIVLPLLAPPVEVLIRMFPPATVVEDVEEPSTEQFVIVSFCAPFMRRIVLVPAVGETVVLDTVSEFPPLFRPFTVTFLAPLKLTSGLPAVVAPITVRTPVGEIMSEVQLPPEGLFRLAVAVPSSVSPAMVTVMLLPVWLVLALIASKAAFNVV